jgi:hypothetical protein
MTIIDLTSAYKGITTPLPAIVSQIENLGWTMGKIQWRKDAYVASARNPHGETVEMKGLNEATAAANVLKSILRLHKVRTAAQKFGGMWNTSWADRLQEVAEAYSKAPVYDPKAAPAWKELARDSMSRMRVLGEQIKIEVVDDPEPYANAQEMAKDIHQKRHFFVSRANSEHPVWSVDENVAFRTVHDVLGHAVSGGDFGWYGENLACAAHFPLLSPLAQKALFTECIAQTAYAIYYRGFGPQKVCFLDDLIEQAQKTENDPAHTGIHPSQVVAPMGMPAIPPQRPEEGVQMDRGFISPHKEDAITNGGAGIPEYLSKRLASKFSTTLRDPNHGWSSGFYPEQGQSAQMDMGLQHPQTGEWVDPIDSHAVVENARLNHREWWNLTKEDGSPDYEAMKQTIINAFRVVLLSPQKELRWNAVHYQDLQEVPYHETDPKKYWDVLERKRQEWNVKHFGPQYRMLHRTFVKQLPVMVGVIQQHYPNLSVDACWEKAHEMIFDWEVKVENKIEMEERAKNGSKSLAANQVYKKVVDYLTKQIETFVQSPGSMLGMDVDLQGNPLPKAPKVKMPGTGKKLPLSQETGEEEGRYGAFMGTHLEQISRLAEHADELLEAALEDVREHDAVGHHFRAKTLGMGVKGVGPKVTSFAWLMLCPLTSQLGTIDTHMLGVLGYDEKDMNDRDYFKMERQLQAARDASGYHNMPLGLFQWGMWDLKRTGVGSHQDHSALAPHEPTAHDAVDWHDTEVAIGDSAKTQEVNRNWKTQPPWWWGQTQEARDAAGADFDAQYGGRPMGKIPYTVEASVREAKVVSATGGRKPWVHHEGTTYWGEPDETFAQVIRKHFNRPAHTMWEADPLVGRYDVDTGEGVEPPNLNPAAV